MSRKTETGSPSFFNIASAGENVKGEFSLPINAVSARYCHWLGLQGLQKGDLLDNGSRPFLSIVTRTQGKRIEELSEVLLCLTGQECMDFEVLLVGHNVEDKLKLQLEDLVQGFPENIASKVRYLSVMGGTRATPLNEAFAKAKGHYIVILDDDDIVFDNWVENFFELARTNYGKILFCYPLRQDWEAYEGYGELHRLRASGGLDPCYCHEFDYIEQLTSNECPQGSVAFPAYAFQELGIRFDESLTTTEDWDFLMRTSFVCGVASCDEPSSIYRIWKNAESSHSLHDEGEWQDNYEKVVAKFNSIPLIFPEGMVKRLARKSKKASYSPGFILEHSFLRIVDSVSENDTSVRMEPRPSNKSGYSIMFQIPTQLNSRKLELHLFDMCCFTLSSFDAWFENSTGDKFWLPITKCKHSGFQVDSRHVIFIEEEPKIQMKLPKSPSFDTLHIRLFIDNKVEEKHARQLAKGHLALWVGRIYRWILRKLHIHS